MPDDPPRTRRRQPGLLDAEGLWSYAVKTLGGRALSSVEIRDRLRRKAANAADIPSVLARLKEYGYIDDARMAETFAASRRDSRGFGKFRVLRDLQQRRIRSTVARNAVESAFAGTDETNLIEEFLARKYRATELPVYLTEEKNLASVYRRLRRAGFSSGASIRVLKRYAAQADELEGMEDSAES